MLSKRIKKPTILLCYYLIYLLFIINVLFNIKLLYLWSDEAFTYGIIHHSFSSIITLTAHDVHPFLYYFIAKIGIIPFHSKVSQIMALRIISAIPYLILLIIGNTTIKHRYSNTVSLIFMFATITMPLLIQNLYQARMYGYATLFITITFLLFTYIYKNIISNSFKSFLAISLFSLLTAYTHYFALISVVLMYGLFLVIFLYHKKTVKYLVASIIIDTIFYLPWLHILLKQTHMVSKNFWIQPLTTKSTAELVLNLFNPNLNLFTLTQNVGKQKIFFLFSLIFIIFIISMLFKEKKLLKAPVYVGLSLPLFTLLVGLILSKILGHTVIILRYLTPVMSIFWLVIALILANLIKYGHYNLLKYLPLILLLILGLISYADDLHQVHASQESFKSALQIYNKIPANAVSLYNSFSTISAPYTPHKMILGNLPKENKKVFHVKSKTDYKLPRSKNVFLLEAPQSPSANISKFSKKFFNKYKSKMIKKGTLQGNFTLYKIYK